MSGKTLTSSERDRYVRQLALPQVGAVGQRKLRKARVLIVGAGGLGSPVALYLAAAGVGTLGLVDFDVVDTGNLQRQVLYSTADVGRTKLDAAAERIRALNPHVKVVSHAERFAPANAINLVSAYDLLIDGTDNFGTRYLVNDACVAAQVPYVYGSVYQFEGQVSLFGAPDGPNVRDLYPQPPDEELTCEEGGVLGVLPGLIGSIQATEALKWILDIGTPLVGRVLLVDALTMQFRSLCLRPDPDNPLRSGRSRDAASNTLPDLVSTPSRSTQPLAFRMSDVPEITVREYQRLRSSDPPPFLLDVRRPEEAEIAHLDGELIPLDELAGRIDELEAHKDDELLVVHCRSGARSAKATQILHQHGFTNAVNLKGGILAWSDEIDTSVQKY